MSYKEKVIRSSQAASSTLFITRCISIMLHVIYLISRLRRFKIFTIFSYGSHFVSVVIFITGPWIISAEQHMQISFFSDWSKGRKCMGIFRFFWGGGREDFMFIFVFQKIFCMADFPQVSKYMATVEELQTVLQVCSELGKQCVQGILISLSVLILLHYLSLKP